MTFIDDYLSVLFHARIDNALAAKTLHQRNVNLPRPPTGTAADLANVLLGDIEKRRDSCNPLCLKLAALHEDERVGHPLRNNSDCDNS